MDAIRQTAGAWAAEEADPPARVWLSLRAQLEQEGLIRDAVHAGELSQKERSRGWLAGIFTVVPRPALAGAYLLALIAVSFALTGPSAKQLNESRWISGTQDSTGAMSAQLQTAEQRQRFRDGRIRSSCDCFPAR